MKIIKVIHWFAITFYLIVVIFSQTMVFLNVGFSFASTSHFLKFIFNLIFIIIGLTAVICTAIEKDILPKWFWKFFSAITALYIVLNLPDFTVLSESQASNYIGILLFSFILSLIPLVAMIYLGFLKRNKWGQIKLFKKKV